LRRNGRIPTYILPAKDIRLLGKFQPDSFKTERLVCVEADGQTDRRTWLDRLVHDADQEYIYFMGSETSPSLPCDQEYIYFMGSETSPSLHCKLLTEIIIPCARVYKCSPESTFHWNKLSSTLYFFKYSTTSYIGLSSSRYV